MRKPYDHPPGAPFTLTEVTAAVRLAYDLPEVAEQLELWEQVFASGPTGVGGERLWFFPMAFLAAMVVAHPETESRVAEMRPKGDPVFEAELERWWQENLAWARGRRRGDSEMLSLPRYLERSLPNRITI